MNIFRYNTYALPLDSLQNKVAGFFGDSKIKNCLIVAPSLHFPLFLPPDRDEILEILFRTLFVLLENNPLD